MSNEEYIVRRFWPAVVVRKPWWIGLLVGAGMLTLHFWPVGVIIIVGSLAWFVVSFIDASDDCLVITPSSIQRIRKTLPFSTDASIIKPQSVLSVTIRQQKLWQKIIDTGTIVIDTAGQSFEFPDAWGAKKAAKAIRAVMQK
jgi:hypothetical protein